MQILGARWDFSKREEKVKAGFQSWLICDWYVDANVPGIVNNWYLHFVTLLPADWVCTVLYLHSVVSLLLKIIILKLNSSVLLAQSGNIIQYSPSSAGRIMENIGPAARAIRKINSSNIAQQGRTILDVSFLEINNVCIMTDVIFKI